MVRIVRHTLTVDAIRARLKTLMAKAVTTRNECAKCNGKGYIEKTAPLSQTDVSKATGLTSPAVSGFLSGKAVSLENGLKLMAWLDAQEHPAEDDDEDEDDELVERKMRLPSHESAQAAAARIAQDRAIAAIDARNRPLSAGGGRG